MWLALFDSPVCVVSLCYHSVGLTFITDPATGTTCDFGYDGAGVPYSYTPELRFMDDAVPTDSIQPSYQEFYNGIKAMVAEIQASP